MNNVADFYLDQGADFNGIVQIKGINNQPVCLHGWHFACQAKYAKNPKIKIDIHPEIDPVHKGILVLRIPYFDTDKMPPGTWLYDIEMCYDDLHVPVNKRMRVVSGKIIVSGQVTTSW
jgi:hypothetical protein